MISSDVVDLEVAAMRDPERRRRVEVLVRTATRHAPTGADQVRRGAALEALGFGAFDALHVACAEAVNADVLLTTDDAFIRRARRLQDALSVRVLNPLTWVQESPG